MIVLAQPRLGYHASSQQDSCLVLYHHIIDVVAARRRHLVGVGADINVGTDVGFDMGVVKFDIGSDIGVVRFDTGFVKSDITFDTFAIPLVWCFQVLTQRLAEFVAIIQLCSRRAVILQSYCSQSHPLFFHPFQLDFMLQFFISGNRFLSQQHQM